VVARTAVERSNNMRCETVEKKSSSSSSSDESSAAAAIRMRSMPSKRSQMMEGNLRQGDTTSTLPTDASSSGSMFSSDNMLGVTMTFDAIGNVAVGGTESVSEPSSASADLEHARPCASFDSLHAVHEEKELSMANQESTSMDDSLFNFLRLVRVGTEVSAASTEVIANTSRNKSHAGKAPVLPASPMPPRSVASSHDRASPRLHFPSPGDVPLLSAPRKSKSRSSGKRAHEKKGKGTTGKTGKPTLEKKSKSTKKTKEKNRIDHSRIREEQRRRNVQITGKMVKDEERERRTKKIRGDGTEFAAVDLTVLDKESDLLYLLSSGSAEEEVAAKSEVLNGGLHPCGDSNLAGKGQGGEAVPSKSRKKSRTRKKIESRCETPFAKPPVEQDLDETLYILLSSSFGSVEDSGPTKLVTCLETKPSSSLPKSGKKNKTKKSASNEGKDGITKVSRWRLPNLSKNMSRGSKRDAFKRDGNEPNRTEQDGSTLGGSKRGGSKHGESISATDEINSMYMVEHAINGPPVAEIHIPLRKAKAPEPSPPDPGLDEERQILPYISSAKSCDTSRSSAIFPWTFNKDFFRKGSFIESTSDVENRMELGPKSDGPSSKPMKSRSFARAPSVRNDASATSAKTDKGFSMVSVPTVALLGITGTNPKTMEDAVNAWTDESLDNTYRSSSDTHSKSEENPDNMIEPFSCWYKLGFLFSGLLLIAALTTIVVGLHLSKDRLFHQSRDTEPVYILMNDATPIPTVAPKTPSQGDMFFEESAPTKSPAAAFDVAPPPTGAEVASPAPSRAATVAPHPSPSTPPSLVPPTLAPVEQRRPPVLWGSDEFARP
jgi:hypothetical protein